MGTDSTQIFSVPGFSLHNEMPAMAKVGMTPYEILKSGPKNGQKIEVSYKSGGKHVREQVNLDYFEAKKASDHYPIWGKFRLIK